MFSILSEVSIIIFKSLIVVSVTYLMCIMGTLFVLCLFSDSSVLNMESWEMPCKC